MGINPGTAEGSKLFQAATKPRDDSDKIDVKISHAKLFIDAMREDSAAFGWGKLINNIRLDDDPLDAEDPKLYSLFEDTQSLTVLKVRRFMGRVFYDPDPNNPIPERYSNNIAFDIAPQERANVNDRLVFYNRVISNMIALRLLGSLRRASKNALLAQKRLFVWKDMNGVEYYDGPTMLQLLIEKVSPTTMSTISTLKEKLRNAKLANFNFSVVDMLDHMMGLNDLIIQQGGTHDDLLLDMFRALETHRNEGFSRAVERAKDDWEHRRLVNPDVLRTEMINKYNNLVEQKRWKITDPRDAKIAALTSQLGAIEKFKASAKPTNFKGSGGGGRRLDVASWRLSKTFGNSTTRDGKTWHWCTKQHNNGKGMYVTHKESDHVDWKQARDKRRDKQKGSSQTALSSTQVSNDSLTLSDSLKAAMMTKFRCTEAEASALWSEAVGNISDEPVNY